MAISLTSTTRQVESREDGSDDDTGEDEDEDDLTIGASSKLEDEQEAEEDEDVDEESDDVDDDENGGKMAAIAAAWVISVVDFMVRDEVDFFDLLLLVNPLSSRFSVNPIVRDEVEAKGDDVDCCWFTGWSVLLVTIVVNTDGVDDIGCIPGGDGVEEQGEVDGEDADDDEIDCC